MPASTAEAPAVALSFANNFWGKDDAGVAPMLSRLAGAKQTCDELKIFYTARASLEDEYARKLNSLCRKPLGSNESGTLKTSLDTLRGEVEQMAKQHQNIAAQMKTELEEPLAAFAGTRDKYEQECLKIKGYLAQGHMVMGQEERRNKAKLEKTQISLATSNTEYENAVQALEETTARWQREWKAAADKFQDLEEERLDFTKSSLWTFANIASTVCVSDDSSCEKIRLSLEKMDVEKDIITFITDRGTGQEIPEAPRYINFCRGDINDSQSETSEDDNYSVAQFPRNINPAFRSSSPQPSTFESHHDPDSALALNLAHRDTAPLTRREPTLSPQKIAQPPPDEKLQQLQQLQQPLVQQQHYQQPPRQQLPRQQPAHQQLSHHQPAQQQLSHHQFAHQQSVHQASPQPLKPLQPLQALQPLQPLQPLQQSPQQQQQPMHQQMAQPMTKPMAPPMRQSLEIRRSTEEQYHRQPAQPIHATPAQIKGYDVSQHGPVAAVPHDPYPMDGMTMLCRTGPPGPPAPLSDRSSQVTSARPSSRDSHSDYSNPTSMSSLEPVSGKTSPVKQDPVPIPSPIKLVAKKKSGFLKNHSPLFRRKSQKEIQATPQSNRNTWHAASARNNASPVRRQPTHNPEAPILAQERTQSPEPIDANASLALGVGQNVFPVANPDEKKRPGATPTKEPEEADPIALALAKIKGNSLGKQSSVRMSADHYHGITTPVPSSEASVPRTVPVPGKLEAASVKRGTPPPSYHTQTQVSRLGVPPPAVTSKAMKEATKKATTQSRSVFGDAAGRAGGYNAAPSRPTTRGTDMSRDSGRDFGRDSGRDSARESARENVRETLREFGKDSGREYGSFSAAPSRSGTRATEMSRGDRGGYTAPPISRTGTRATDVPSPIARPGTRGTDVPSPIARPGTRGSDMSRGGSGVYGTSPGSRPGTRGTDMPRATSPAPLRSVSPQPPRNDSSRMSYRSASPNPYAGTQRSPSQMSSPQKRGSDHYYQQPSQQEASRAPSPTRYRDYARPQSSYGGSEMAVQLADPYGSQRSRSSRPESRATAHYNEDGSRQRSKSVADPSRLYTSDGRPILHYARALYVYQAAIPEELGFAKGDYLAVLRHQDDAILSFTCHSTSTFHHSIDSKIHASRVNRCARPAMETLQQTARLATSKPVQRVVVNTILLGSSAVTLLGLAGIASALFFQNFLPHEVVTTPLYLQYGSGANPYGIASIATPPMKTQQEYDISLTLSMPRSSPNVERGNFMISLHLLDATADGRLDTSAQLHAAEHGGFGETKVLFSSRRSALLPYVDPFVSLATRIIFLFYHIFAPGSSTSEMVIPLAERVWFPKGSKMPGSAYVEVEAGQTIQVYHAALRLTAQLRGLRWLMVHYRVSTYLAFTFLFWACELVFMGIAWGIWSATTGSPPGDAGEKTQRLEGAWRQAVKDEEEEGGEQRDEDDGPATFPTYGRQPALKYEPNVKHEAVEEQPLSELPRGGAEADDEGDDEEEEEEDDDGRNRDSGLGTSYSEEGSGRVRRRQSRNLKE
ncbi:hypothetical protein B0J13DRAFT_617767 [Dactylonectria estremocensis]|uniref:F-BAR domain-containing protein n=1 Tax=Dactylonectria estremocensis TaxID=1079267 RepID=A0A9P9JEN5_9HYPO|nr:hypothetical protein B0J13DRAFT_617767 [Dactylonectria estremocensis]